MLIGADKLAAFSAASMFALPSYSENFGIAIVEAMAAGLPAIVSDQVNIYREIEGGGAIVVPCEVGAVTRAIESLAADPVRLRQMAAEARETARKLYDWRNVAMSLENLYREFAR
jgi:glycosyltransferase involved in cell wall biosynthesis